MKQQLFNTSVKLSRADQRHVKLVAAIVSLTLFALGASAPGAFSGF